MSDLSERERLERSWALGLWNLAHGPCITPGEFIALAVPYLRVAEQYGASLVAPLTGGRRLKRVYVAGPYTKGDVAVNVREACRAADWLASSGLAPYIPHLTHFWHMLYPRPYEYWLALDLEFLPACDALLRLPGESHGADGEVAEAERIGLPVFYTVPDVLAWAAACTAPPEKESVSGTQAPQTEGDTY